MTIEYLLCTGCCELMNSWKIGARKLERSGGTSMRIKCQWSDWKASTLREYDKRNIRSETVWSRQTRISTGWRADSRVKDQEPDAEGSPGSTVTLRIKLGLYIPSSPVSRKIGFLGGSSIWTRYGIRSPSFNNEISTNISCWKHPLPSVFSPKSVSLLPNPRGSKAPEDVCLDRLVLI